MIGAGRAGSVGPAVDLILARYGDGCKKCCQAVSALCQMDTHHNYGPVGAVRAVELFVVEGRDACLQHSRSQSLGHSCSNCWLLSFICLASLSIMYRSIVLFLLLVYLSINKVS